MASGIPGEPTSGMIARIKGILMQPKAEWAKIDSEPASVQGLMMGWVVPLAAIGPVCQLIGTMLFGVGVGFGVTLRPSLGFAISQAVTTYVLALVGAFVCHLIFDALATGFGGTKNPVQAMKGVAYSFTAVWVAGIFQLIPMLGIIGLIASLYSLYLLYLGLPLLMKVPQDKALAYVAVSIVVAVVVFVVAGALVAAVSGMFAPRPVPYGSVTFG